MDTVHNNFANSSNEDKKQRTITEIMIGTRPKSSVQKSNRQFQKVCFGSTTCNHVCCRPKTVSKNNQKGLSAIVKMAQSDKPARSKNGCSNRFE
jgi:hypothetical protein